MYGIKSECANTFVKMTQAIPVLVRNCLREISVTGQRDYMFIPPST